ncbi:hypothetical protein K438DRAFT_1979787 [Mycena galopus ATCC 62051]|nr:hypothetical protein K438DRAFT_1979787 [Mycena galopus ATCC 62051]
MLSRRTPRPSIYGSPAPAIQSRKKDEEEHNAALEFLKKFQNYAQEYYGDGDEGRGVGVTENGGRRGRLSYEPMPPVADGDPAAASARATAAHITFLTREMLMGPRLPTTVETEGLMLHVMKCTLFREHFGE